MKAKNYRQPFFIKLLIVSTLFFSACFKHLPNKYTVYENDFETGIAKSITIFNINGKLDSSKIFFYNGTKALGPFNNNQIDLQLSSLPKHNAIKIVFDLYIHDQWNGDFLIPGGNQIPDVWNLTLDNYPIHSTTFSNTNYGQSFPNNYLAGARSNPARSDAWNINLPGICALKSSPNGSSRYSIEITTAHTNSEAKITCNDALQPFGSYCLKSWSIDNVVITAIHYN